MVGQLIKSIYAYKDVILESGAKITANQVHIKDGIVNQIDYGTVYLNEQQFSFSIYPYGINGKLQYNLNNVPSDINGQEILKEFVNFVEADIQ